MKIIHITPKSNGYEEVELLANRYSKKNHLAVIKYPDGILNITGGLLINDTPEIRKVLDSIPKEKQYDFILSIKIDPFASAYYEDDKKTELIEGYRNAINTFEINLKQTKWWKFRRISYLRSVINKYKDLLYKTRVNHHE